MVADPAERPGRRLGVDGAAITGYSDPRAAVLGVATFFLPCGFTQAVQVYALSTGSPLTAGAIMAVFAIGTAPGLLALAGLRPSSPARLARPSSGSWAWSSSSSPSSTQRPACACSA